MEEVLAWDMAGVWASVLGDTHPPGLMSESAGEDSPVAGLTEDIRRLLPMGQRPLIRRVLGHSEGHLTPLRTRFASLMTRRL